MRVSVTIIQQNKVLDVVVENEITQALLIHVKVKVVHVEANSVKVVRIADPILPRVLENF